MVKMELRLHPATCQKINSSFSKKVTREGDDGDDEIMLLLLLLVVVMLVLLTAVNAEARLAVGARNGLSSCLLRW